MPASPSLEAEAEELVEAPGEVGGAEEAHGPGLGEVGAGEVVVADVGVGAQAVVQEQDDVVHDRRVQHERPVEGMEGVVGEGESETEDDGPAEEAGEGVRRAGGC